MLPRVIFAGQSASDDVFSCAGKYGAVAVSFPLLGHGRPTKQKLLQSVFGAITESSGLLEQPLWAESFFDRLSTQMADGQLSQLEELNLSITVVEPVSGGVRVGNLGGHYVCMKWSDGSIGRLMQADTLAEHPSVHLVSDDYRGIIYRMFNDGSTIKSLYWRTQLLSDGAAVVVVAPQAGVKVPLEKLQSQIDLIHSDPYQFCKRVVSDEVDMCLVATRSA